MNIGNIRGRIVAIGDVFFQMEAVHFNGVLLPDKVLVPSEFRTSIQDAEIGNIVQLVDVENINDRLQPRLVIIEPDYLLDVSSIAECMRDYGSHPFYFFINRCSDKSNTAPILLGNAANFFLDELVHADNTDAIDMYATIKKYFQLDPIGISACKDLRDRALEMQFFESLKLHFEHLKFVVQTVLHSKNINRKTAVLEPSFVCPDIGLQGRLDFFEYKTTGTSSVIELKSGKTPFGDDSNQAIALNHQTQASLYQMMIQQVLRLSFSRLETYICYSRCGAHDNPLRLAHPSMALIAQALNIRNHIVLNDYKVAFKKMNPGKLFSNIVPDRMVLENYRDSRLVTQYIAPYIERFSNVIQKANELERAYFFAYYQFIIKEQWLSKCGTDESKERSLSSLWALSFEEKKHNGMLLDGLRIVQKQVQYDYTIVTFSYMINYDIVADFREGDIVVLYPQVGENDSARNHQVFKGSVMSIGDSEMVLRLRNHQYDQVLPNDLPYCIEHDVLDHNFTAQFRGLYKFLSVASSRRDLILGNRRPVVTEKMLDYDTVHTSKIQELVQKVWNADELFLLVGPPGTGKTSVALKSLVAFYYLSTSESILLTAYTNRAVDEICSAIEAIAPNIAYVRLGSHINCSPDYQKKLLSEQVKSCANRKDVQHFIQSKRIYVGTLAAVASNPELLQNKHFGLGVVDEASQVLDPLLLNLFCTQNDKGKLSIDKFVLIGDEKQLPAVCLQESAHFENPLLVEKGILSGKVSFFERMLRRYCSDEDIVAVLDKQGRMHPDVARFSNYYFYNAGLSEIPLPHQEGELSWKTVLESGMQQTISQKRNVFFPIEENGVDGAKAEAVLVAALTKTILEMYHTNNHHFHGDYSLGIITPFRSQIALIRKALRALEIPELNRVVVDTVERYQGGQRDMIIYAFGVYSQMQLVQVTDATMLSEGQLVDRKLNVALTRARKQFFFVGSSYWTQQNELYKKLVDFLENGML
ncbi:MULTISPECIES: DEAD/DEAH box helicase [Chitinophagaceae]